MLENSSRKRCNGDISGGATSRFVVAALPFNMPLAAKIMPPVQTETMGIVAA